MNPAIVCNYAVIRFLPYPDVGEFVNIGVVVACPEIGFFDFKMPTRRWARVTDFFPEVDVELLHAGRKMFAAELQRVKTMLTTDRHPDQARMTFEQEAFRTCFKELVRLRESVFRFGPIGTAITENPSIKLEELFAHYVSRQFATHDLFQETVMAKRLAAVFRAADLAATLRPRRFGDDIYHYEFPFVRDTADGKTRAIRPLHLAQQDTTKIIDHGDQWCRRIVRLRRMNSFPDEVLFVVKQPDGEGKRRDVARQIEDEIRALDVQIAQEAAREDVLTFARAV